MRPVRISLPQCIFIFPEVCIPTGLWLFLNVELFAFQESAPKRMKTTTSFVINLGGRHTLLKKIGRGAGGGGRLEKGIRSILWEFTHKLDFLFS